MSEWKSFNEWVDAVKVAQAGGEVDKRLEPSENGEGLTALQVMLMECFAMGLETESENDD